MGRNELGTERVNETEGAGGGNGTESAVDREGVENGEGTGIGSK